MTISPFLRELAADRANELRAEAARARRIAAAWAYKRSARRWTWYSQT
jgi:hypothetical protein